MSRRYAPSPFAILRKFCEFWIDRRHSLPCCQFVDQDVIDSEPDDFDCDTCHLQIEFARLDTENARAWDLYGRLCSRFAVDAGIVPDLLRNLVDGWSPSDVVDALERCAVVHDVLNPPPPRQT